MARKRVARIRYDFSPDTVVIRAEARTPRGSYFASGETMVTRRGMSKADRRTALRAGLDRLLGVDAS